MLRASLTLLLLLSLAGGAQADEGAQDLAEFSIDASSGVSLRDYSTLASHESLQGDFFLACMAGDVPEARSMLSQGARLDAEDAFGRRALHLAAINARAALAAELLSLGADAAALDSGGRTALESVQVLQGEAEEAGDAALFDELEAVRRVLRRQSGTD
jgi:ankyrin repeat protein